MKRIRTQSARNISCTCVQSKYSLKISGINFIYIYREGALRMNNHLIMPKETIKKDGIRSSKEEKFSISFNSLSLAVAIVSIAFSEAGGQKYVPWCCTGFALLLLVISYRVLKGKNNEKYIWIILICTATIVIVLIVFSFIKMYKTSGTVEKVDNKMTSVVIDAATPTPTTRIINYAAEETPSLAGYFTDKYPAEEYSEDKLIALGDYFCELEMFDKAIECYLSNQVVSDSSARKSVQAKLGYIFSNEKFIGSKDSQLQEKYQLVALSFFDAALAEGDYSVLTPTIILRAYSCYPDYNYDILIDNIKLAYKVKNETISQWISAMMKDQGYIETENGYIEQFCDRLSKDEQIKLFGNLVEPIWSCSYISYDKYHPDVRSENGFYQETFVFERNGIYTYISKNRLLMYRYYEYFVDADAYDYFHGLTEEFLSELNR